MSANEQSIIRTSKHHSIPETVRSSYNAYDENSSTKNFIERKGQILNLGGINPGAQCLISEDFNGKTAH